MSAFPLDPMTVALSLILIQAVLGAADNLVHHELEAALPARPGARLELTLHAAREAIYAVVFFGLAWLEWRGAFALVLAAIMAAEVAITLKDFLVEDRTRRLPPAERVLHTVLALGFGAILAVLAPIVARWFGQPTALVVHGHGALSWLMSLCGVGVAAWSVRNAIAVISLGAPPRLISTSEHGGTVLVTGATGFIGRAVTEALVAQGRRVFILTRDRLAAHAQFGDAVRVVEDLAELPAELRLQAVINLAGASVAGGLWTKARRRALLASRLATTQALLALMARLETPPDVLVNASAVGFYGDRGEELLDETSNPGAGFMAELCGAWEAEAAKADALGVRTVLLRLGLVFDQAGGVLPLLTLPARFGMGAILGDGKQWAPWISRDDVVRMTIQALDDPRWRGPIAAVAPDLVTQGEFTRRLSKALGRPHWLTVPAWPVRTALGEMSDLFLAGQRLLPKQLWALGFEFTKPTLESAVAPSNGPLRLPRAWSAPKIPLFPAKAGTQAFSETSDALG